MRKLLFVLCLLHTYALFAQVPNTLSAADKVYGLSKCWQEANYNFVYLNRINRAQWDSTYRAMITQVQSTTNDYDYYQLLQKFYAGLHDGHTYVSLPGKIVNLQLTKMFGEYWLGTENIDGKAIITRTLKARMKEIPIGSEIIEVNGMPTAKYLTDSVKPYIASSTDYTLEDEAIGGLLRGMTGASYRVKIKRPDGSVLPLTLTHERTKDTAFYPPFPPQAGLLQLKWYNNDIAYLALNAFDDEKIDSLFLDRLPELYKAKALVIDLRNNGGGSTNIGTTILQYLIPDSAMQGFRTSTRQHIGVQKAWGKYLKPEDTIGNAWNKTSWAYNHDDFYFNFDYHPHTFHLQAKRLVVPTLNGEE